MADVSPLLSYYCSATRRGNMHRPCLFAAVVLVIGAGAVAQPTSDGRLAEDQAAYIARCRSETTARYPNAGPQANSICQSIWSQIVSAGPIAEAIVAATPRQGVAFNPSTVSAALPSIRWAGTPAQGSIASGRSGGCRCRGHKNARIRPDIHVVQGGRTDPVQSRGSPSRTRRLLNHDRLSCLRVSGGHAHLSGRCRRQVSCCPHHREARSGRRKSILGFLGVRRLQRALSVVGVTAPRRERVASNLLLVISISVAEDTAQSHPLHSSWFHN